MKVQLLDRKNIKFRLTVDNPDDLWYLSYIIEATDFVRARTLRKIKIGSDDDRSTSIVKKPVFLKIEVERVEFHKYSNVLRVSGKIAEGPEDIPLGSYHTISLEPGSEIELHKKELLRYQEEKLREAAEDRNEKILLCVHDREEAYLALLKRHSYEILTIIRGEVSKKDEASTSSKDFYSEVAKAISMYDERYGFQAIVIGSPAFFKEYLIAKIEDERIRKRIIPATCSSVGDNGIMELMKRPEVRKALVQSRVAREASLIDELLSEISKSGKAAYGLDEVRGAVDIGAVSELLVSESLIMKKRQDGTFAELEGVMRRAEKNGANVNITMSEYDSGQKLDGLGGIGAILRYKLSY